MESINGFIKSCKKYVFVLQDSSSVVEWAHTPKEKTPRGPEHMNSYEAEWDMVSTVSFKKKPHSNGGTRLLHCTILSAHGQLGPVKDDQISSMVISPPYTNHVEEAVAGWSWWGCYLALRLC